jgi:hypothetical protein
MRRNSLRRNPAVFGKDVVGDVLLPLAIGGVSLMGARWLSARIYESRIVFFGESPEAAEITAAAAGTLATLWMADSAGSDSLLSKNAPAAIVGMGLAALEPVLSRLMKIDPIRVARAVDQAVSQPGTGSYYSSSDLGRGYDISHYGAPYKGMLGIEESVFEGRYEVPAVSTVTPTDLALRAPRWLPDRKVTEKFANRNGRAHAGGTFARDLFSSPY